MNEDDGFESVCYLLLLFYKNIYFFILETCIATSMFKKFRYTEVAAFNFLLDSAENTFER